MDVSSINVMFQWICYENYKWKNYPSPSFLYSLWTQLWCSNYYVLVINWTYPISTSLSPQRKEIDTKLQIVFKLNFTKHVFHWSDYVKWIIELHIIVCRWAACWCIVSPSHHWSQQTSNSLNAQWQWHPGTGDQVGGSFVGPWMVWPEFVGADVTHCRPVLIYVGGPSKDIQNGWEPF